MATEAVYIGAIDASAVNPHMNVDLLIKTAKDSHADAIHPGEYNGAMEQLS